ncbi:hypothetical protein EMIHUDRAFT_236172 [Emiliania huxleyi CCMP1516]|uniref:Major facilitator superfamily (MFS) profile domain-containing protein n=2 Tax=Emiliania huxleyi TaxID=2903 RepID=A0A0D3JTZ6_EMIH1|nr:hypothetical protein EMIHUDRAFT_236172 [Emiliania huxleyi CCMP1516]EOD26981.1 hypothetical protein EMIHUDRAFT_236172 [Emiliania huxleyi CCMP1516]|eukprot:XP_005779410.1 hypothetical protein EMIHUDRAFT_236172 [Emiliania huxleyi CCMP1516]
MRNRPYQQGLGLRTTPATRTHDANFDNKERRAGRPAALFPHVRDAASAEEDAAFPVVAFAGTFAIYASCYLARNNAAVAKIAYGGALSTAHLASADAAFLSAYTLSSFLFASASEKAGGWRVACVGLLAAGLSQAGVVTLPGGAAPDWRALAACYALNGLSQGALFPACKAVLANSIPARIRGKAIAAWNTSFYLGGVAATAVASQLLSMGYDWRALYLLPACLLSSLALGLLPLDPGEGTEFGAGLAPGGTTAIATATVSSSGGYELWGCGLTYAAVKMLRYSLMLLGLLLPLLPTAATIPDAMLRQLALVGAALSVGIATGAAETVQGSLAPLAIAERLGGAPGRAVGFVNGCGSVGSMLAAPLLPLLSVLAVRMGMHSTDALGLLAPVAGASAAMVYVFGRKRIGRSKAGLLHEYMGHRCLKYERPQAWDDKCTWGGLQRLHFVVHPCLLG